MALTPPPPPSSQLFFSSPKSKRGANTPLVAAVKKKTAPRATKHHVVSMKPTPSSLPPYQTTRNIGGDNASKTAAIIGVGRKAEVLWAGGARGGVENCAFSVENSIMP